MTDTTANGSLVERLSAGLDRRRWLIWLLLLLPFLPVLISHQFLAHHFVTTTSVDETSYHYPTIVEFARQFPYYDFSDYLSATAPLYHVVFSWLFLAGFDLQAMRLANFAISFVGVLLVFHFLRRHIRANTFQALIYSLLFAISPYYYGLSFVLMTDNAALVLAIACLYSLANFRQSNAKRDFLMSVFFATAAMLTRQIYVVLLLPCMVYVLRGPGSNRYKLYQLLILMASAIPLSLLITLWGGPTPPQFLYLNANTRTLDFTGAAILFSLIGLYGLLLGHEFFFERGREWRKQLLWMAAVFIAVWMLLAFFPITPFPSLRDGYLWRISNTLPLINRTGVPYLLLLPLGLIFLARRWGQVRWDSLAVLGVIGITIGSLRSSAYFQKYYDPFALWTVFQLVAMRPWRHLLQFLLPAVLFALFVGYHFARPLYTPPLPTTINQPMTRSDR